MKLIHATLAAGLLAGSLLAGSSSHGLPPLAATAPATPVTEGDYQDLLERYAKGLETWEQQLRDADKKERRALRANHPANTFWAEFESHSKAGNGEAKLWLCEHILDRKLKSRERAKVLTPLFQDLARDHSSAEWFDPVVPLIHRHRRILGTEVAQGLYRTVLASSKSPEQQAAALYFETRLFKAKKGEVPNPIVKANLDRILAEFRETSWASRVIAARATELSAVGAQAPEFTAKTIDDFEFKLSDYKGKVVLLDFYGFW